MAPPPAPAVEPTPPPAKPKRTPRRHRRERASGNTSDPPQPWFRAALYPAVKSGYVSGESTFAVPGAPDGSMKVDANTVALEPHIDALLIFKGLIGVGASGGYMWAVAKGLGGWTFTPFVMLAITPSLSLKANYGIVEGSVDYDETAMSSGGPVSIDTSAKRYGGGIYYLLSSSDSTSIGLGLEVLHMESPMRDNTSYNGNGGFIDLAISFDDH